MYGSVTLPPADDHGELGTRAHQYRHQQEGVVDSTTLGIAGQFEDAADDHDHDGGKHKHNETEGSLVRVTTQSTGGNTNALAWLAAAAECSATVAISSANSTPRLARNLPATLAAPGHLERDISTSTCHATEALLEMARSAKMMTMPTAAAAPPPPSPQSKKTKKNKKDKSKTTKKKKKKTFLVRLDELREYQNQHGTLRDLDNPVKTANASEQNLRAWLQDCRKKYRAGQLSDEKAKALDQLGCLGFSAREEEKSGDDDDKEEEEEEEEDQGDEQERLRRTEARRKKEHARRLEEHMIREQQRMEYERRLHHHHQQQHQHQQQLHQEQSASHSHPALRALWLQQRQEEEARRLQQQMRALASARSNATRSNTVDQEATDGDMYAAAESYPSMAQQQQSLQEARLYEEMYAREAMAREALVREQRLAAAMRGMGGFAHPNAAISAALLQQQQGRVMSLLQPLETVPPRAMDPFLMRPGGPYQDPRFNAALFQARMMQHQHQAQQQQHQQQQRRASDAALQQQLMLRRPSDASASAVGPETSNPTSPNVKRVVNNSVARAPLLSDKVEPTVDEEDSESGGAGGSSNNAAIKGKPRKSWDERMKEMWHFFLTHGHTKVQTRGEHKELGRWLSSVRCRMRDGLLPQHQVKEYLAMQEWTMDEDDEEAAAAAEEENVPASPAAAGPNHFSRRNSAATESSDDAESKEATSSEEVVAPMGICPNSSLKTKRALPKSWNQSFAELQTFKARFGHVDVKMIGNSPFGSLGKWLASQRSRYKLGQLPEDKVERLRSLDCTGFETRDESEKENERSLYRQDDEEAEFDAAIRRLKAAKDFQAAMATHHTVDDRASPTDSDPSSPTLKEKRVRHSYDARIAHIKEFRDKHGHCKVRLGSNDKHEELLARWLASARSRYRGGHFKEERAEELRALGCDGFEPLGSVPDDANVMVEEPESPVTKKREAPARTATPSPAPSLEAEDDIDESPTKKQRVNVKRQTFSGMLKELEAYQYLFGVGCSVPKPDGEKGKLGRWLAFQRRQFIAGKLPLDRVEKLRAIGRKEFSAAALLVRAAEMSAESGTDQ